jgi:serine phosphatase RsbU (regulator of sigma subunit)
MFSDGFRDQFGGDNSKKFGTQQFHQLLQRIHTEPMPRQEAILKDTILRWMKDQDQLDDMLIMGFRVA